MPFVSPPTSDDLDGNEICVCCHWPSTSRDAPSIMSAVSGQRHSRFPMLVHLGNGRFWKVRARPVWRLAEVKKHSEAAKRAEGLNQP
jgi:hypothetical protein